MRSGSRQEGTSLFVFEREADAKHSSGTRSRPPNATARPLQTLSKERNRCLDADGWKRASGDTAGGRNCCARSIDGTPKIPRNGVERPHRLSIGVGSDEVAAWRGGVIKREPAGRIREVSREWRSLSVLHRRSSPSQSRVMKTSVFLQRMSFCGSETRNLRPLVQSLRPVLETGQLSDVTEGFDASPGLEPSTPSRCLFHPQGPFPPFQTSAGLSRKTSTVNYLSSHLI